MPDGYRQPQLSGWPAAMSILGALLGGAGAIKGRKRERFLGRKAAAGQKRPLEEEEQRKVQRALGRSGARPEAFEAFEALGLPMEERPAAQEATARQRELALGELLGSTYRRPATPAMMELAVALQATPEQQMFMMLPPEQKFEAAQHEFGVPTKLERRGKRVTIKGQRGRERRAEAEVGPAAERHEWARAGEARAAAGARAGAAEDERAEMLRRAVAQAYREGLTPETEAAIAGLGGDAPLRMLQQRQAQQEVVQEAQQMAQANAIFREVDQAAMRGPIPEALARQGYDAARLLLKDDERARKYMAYWTEPDPERRKLLKLDLAGAAGVMFREQTMKRLQASLEQGIEDRAITDSGQLVRLIRQIAADPSIQWPEAVQQLLPILSQRLREANAQDREAERDMGTGPAVAPGAGGLMPGPRVRPKPVGAAAAAELPTFATSEVVEYDHKGQNPGRYIGYVVGTPKKGSKSITVQFPRQKIPGKAGYTKAVRRTLPYSKLMRTTKPLPSAAPAAAGPDALMMFRNLLKEGMGEGEK